MKTVKYLLPAHWASYLINCDVSGYTDEEAEAIDKWEVANAPGPCIDCGEEGFTWRGDDGVQGAQRSVFTFVVIEPIYSDGDVIGYHV